jgi:hypothetical protein
VGFVLRAFVDCFPPGTIRGATYLAQVILYEGAFIVFAVSVVVPRIGSPEAAAQRVVPRSFRKRCAKHLGARLCTSRWYTARVYRRRNARDPKTRALLVI